mmetsp:Transcript_96902/g.301645  ORF Transcript_96902/g.301645 Transcript_96902/m.301645 type:complete len:231 (+) Transcript_96902:650-1342(+)
MLPLEVLERVLPPDCIELLREPGVQALKDVVETPVEHLQDFVVVILERHLQVESRELGHVPVSEGLLGPEDRADLEDARHVRHQRHLLVQLRGLCKVGLALKVLDLEHVRAPLRRAGDHLRRVDLLELLLQQELPEEAAHSRLNPEDRLVCHGAQVKNAVVQAHVGIHLDQARVLLVLLLRPAQVGQLDGQHRRGPSDAVDPLYADLHSRLRAGDNRGLRACNSAEHVDD